jgi:beta-lactamase class D
MTRRPSFRVALLLTVALVATGCSKIERAVKTATGGAPAPFDKARLDAAIDKSMGGPSTCVVLLDAGNGSEAYRYGLNAACERELPPCSTFHIASTLIALDEGKATPATVFKWNHTPQPATSWERDVDLTTAFKQSIDWVFQDLARGIGAPTLGARLKAFGYGNGVVTGPVDGFWQGATAGGGLAISTRGQARFLQRLYAGTLPVKPESTAFVTARMVDEIRDGSTMSGRMGTCPTLANGSRQVGWWVGRLKGQKSDYLFAASIEGENALPGLEVQTRLKYDLAQAGVWPAMP